MSQRLHIGKTENGIYDCVLVGNKDAYEKLISEWFTLRDGIFAGPWKIRIGDTKLFNKLEPTLENVFRRFGKQYPDDIWVVYQDERSIEHPTKDEFKKWLKTTA